MPSDRSSEDVQPVAHPSDGLRFKPSEQVAVATDRFAGEGAPRGTVGLVLEVYLDPPGYEIEVTNRSTGHTIALFSARPDEVQHAL